MAVVWIAGGSGLVGAELLRLLLEEDAFTTVVAVGRRTLPIEHAKLEQATVDFLAPHAFDPLRAPTVAMATLGTTIKKAGSREAFRAVDHEAVLAFARAARAAKASSFLHVTSLGADPAARGFYARVKGEVEQAVAELGFDSVYALRPSILDGDRTESRPLEELGVLFGRALGPVLGKYRPTAVSAVARTMVTLAKKPARGTHVIEADRIT